jgi:hypothetical protein
LRDGDILVVVLYACKARKGGVVYILLIVGYPTCMHTYRYFTRDSAGFVRCGRREVEAADMGCCFDSGNTTLITCGWYSASAWELRCWRGGEVMDWR